MSSSSVARLDALRSDFAEEARTQRIEIGAELKSLEGLIKDLSRELMAASPAFAAAAAEEVAGTSEIPLRLEERLERVNLAALDDEPEEEEAVDLLADETLVVTEETVVLVTEPASVADEPQSCRRTLHRRGRARLCRSAPRDGA